MVAKSERELAYLYDLYIVPTWRECFDSLFDENVILPTSGEILDINCGTGGHSLELADRVKQAQVIALDPNKEMVTLAQAKADIAKVLNIDFRVANSDNLKFTPESFDLIILDISFHWREDADYVAKQAAALASLLKPKGQLVLKLTTRGSFDEFFSILWEALYECGLAERLLSDLEALVSTRPSLADLEEAIPRQGFKIKQSVIQSETLLYDTAANFLISPLIENYWLDNWLSIVPPSATKKVCAQLAQIIDRERAEHSFDLSVKATLLILEKQLGKAR